MSLAWTWNVALLSFLLAAVLMKLSTLNLRLAGETAVVDLPQLVCLPLTVARTPVCRAGSWPQESPEDVHELTPPVP
jgi:hypothetical protein